ncbi:MAG: HEAT repeat domain-containing protein [Bryobacteraceae bacterium]
MARSFLSTSFPGLMAAVALSAIALSLAPQLLAQDGDARQRAKAVRDLAKQGDDSIPKIAAYIADSDVTVRVEAIKALVEIGGPKTLDGLIRAAGDNDPEVQIRATDGIVNVYLPGYVKNGLSGTLSRAGSAVKGKFTDTNDQIIDAFVQVRPEAITALGKLARGGNGMDSRANAARAIGVLRGRAALPDLIEALHSKDDKLMYESLVAVQKIGDPSAAPRIAFLLKDLEERIQIQTLETTGLLKNKEAAKDVRDALEHARTVKIRRAALGALAQIADPADRNVLAANIKDKDDGVRAAAAEGLGRIGNTADRDAVTQAYNGERGMSPRLAAAYAMVSLGERDIGRYSPLRYLVNSLNQKSWRGVAIAYVIELARSADVRKSIYAMLAESSKDEKIQLSSVLAASGDKDSEPVLEGLSRDADPDVAAEGIRGLRTLRARLR